MTVWTPGGGTYTLQTANCNFFGYNEFRLRDITEGDFALGQLAAGMAEQNPLLAKWDPIFGFAAITAQPASGSGNDYPVQGYAGAFLQKSTDNGHSWTFADRINPGIAGDWGISMVKRPNGRIPLLPGGGGFTIGNHPFWGAQLGGSLKEINGAHMFPGNSQSSVLYGRAAYEIDGFSAQRPTIWVPEDNMTVVSGDINFGPWPTLDTGVRLLYRWRQSPNGAASPLSRGQIYYTGTSTQGQKLYRYAVVVPPGGSTVDIELTLLCERAPGHVNTWLANVRPENPRPSTLANFTETFRLKGGDIDANGIVDIADYSHLAAHFGKSSTSADWFQHINGVSPVMSDITGNNIVDVGDYSVLSGNFSEVEVLL